MPRSASMHESSSAMARERRGSDNSARGIHRKSTSEEDGTTKRQEKRPSANKTASPQAEPVPTKPSDDNNAADATVSPKQPRKLSVAALIRSFSPRAKAKADGAMTSELTTDTKSKTKTPVATFGKLKRSSLSFPASSSSDSKSNRTKPNLHVEIPPPSTAPSIKPPSPRASHSNIDDAFTTGPGSVVDEVRTTLVKLLAAMDALDPRKLPSIRLGGELRGLLGKAQDEFAAYEEAFRSHAVSVGVTIALQNFGAALHQVFAIVARLQHAKLLLLNRSFKREVTFAFQEINSYYTSMFMELSMAVAQTSGRPLPLPSPVKAPVIEQEEEESDKPTEPTPTSLCLEAHACYFGHGRSVDRRQALDLYTRAAALGSSEAMRCLGCMFWRGSDATPRDVFVAEQWLTRAVAAGEGDAEAAYLLGSLLLEQAPQQKTPGLTQETAARGRRQIAMAADRGHADAQYWLGKLIEKAGDNDGDGAQSAVVWYRRAAEQSHRRAQAALGRLLLTLAEGSDSEAVHWLQLAVAVGDDSDSDGEALALLGELYSSSGGRGGVNLDVDRAIRLLRRAVAAGNQRAMLRLALVLLHSRGTQSTVALQDGGENHDEALRLLLNAAHCSKDQDDTMVATEALFQVGELLYSSPLLRDRSAALRFYLRAAAADPPHAGAAKRAANLLYSGSGLAVAVDRKRAHELYAIAAKTGDAEALNSMGLMHEDGDGCTLDFREAAACYRRAAMNGHGPAHFNLGCLLAHGKGVARDLAAAQTHFEQALALGYALAQDFLPPR